MKQRITIIGDMMCEPLLLKAARQSNGEYCFDGVFEHVKDLFAASDLVIGNLCCDFSFWTGVLRHLQG